jgi:hypothetical protein
MAAWRQIGNPGSSGRLGAPGCLPLNIFGCKTKPFRAGALPRVEYAGQPKWRTAVPTVLPPRRRNERNKAIASIVFNIFLLVSALGFAAVVLVREQNYALGQSSPDFFDDGTADAPAAAAPEGRPAE